MEKETPPITNILLNNVNICKRPNNLPILQTSRLTLREININDITDEYVNWLNNPEINKFLEIRFTHQTRKSVEEFVLAKLSDIRSSMHFGIFDLNGSRLVGTVSLSSILQEHQTSDISFIIGHPEAQNLGYASEAVHAVTHFSFTQGNLVKLFAGYYDGHLGSAKVLAKNGYKIEGRIKEKYINHEGKRVDHIIVGLLSSEYQQLRKEFK